MKQTTITSIYGKTLAFKPYTMTDRNDAVEVTYREEGGAFKGGMVFDKGQIDALRAALAVPVSKPDEGIFFLMRQKKSNPSKVKVCFAPDGLRGGVHDPKNKEYHSRERADRACANQNANYGDKWTYFVVEKETV